MNKEAKTGYIVILVLWVILGLIILRIVNYIQNKEKLYEYAVNEEIGVSSNCYLKEDIAFCENNKELIQVDSYYEAE